MQEGDCGRGRECWQERESDPNKKELLSVPRERQGSCVREGNRFHCSACVLKSLKQCEVPLQRPSSRQDTNLLSIFAFGSWHLPYGI